MANCKLSILLFTFVLFCYMATTTTKIVSFKFCMEVNGQLGCYDMYSGRTSAEFPANENFFGVKLNELANPNFQSLLFGGFQFSISLNVSYLQIVNVTSREQKAYELNFHPLALGISHNSPGNFHLYVIGVNSTGKCDEQGKLIFHYVTFSVSNCHDNERWPCPSSSYYKLFTAKNCSEQIPLIALSPDSNGDMVLLFAKSASESLFCYSLTSYGQCGYPLGSLPQDYTIVVYHPYRESIILQIKYDNSKYKCYSFGYEGFNELPHECPSNAKMVTPRTFRSTVSGASILYRNNTAPGGFEELNDVIGDPVEIENGLGLIYVSGIAELTVKGPGLFGGKQTLATQDPICKDAHNNALLLAMSENGKQLTVLLCPKNQDRYLQGFIQANGTYSPIPIHEKSVINSSGPISLSFFLGTVEHQVIPRHVNSDPPPIATPFQMNLLIPIVLGMIFLVVVVISGTVFPIACYQRIRRRRNHRLRNSSRRDDSNENLELLLESRISSQASLFRNPQMGIQVLVTGENDEGPDVVQVPQSHNEHVSQPPLCHEERENENMFGNESSSNATPSTQQMTLQSSYENESGEPAAGHDRKKSVEPASTQSPPLQDNTILGSRGKSTITASLNGEGEKEHSVHDLHPALTPTDPLQGNTVHENEGESTVVSPPKESSSNATYTPSTQQMTLQSSYENESSEPAAGHDRKKSVEPASTQSPPLQDNTTPGSRGKSTITASLNGEGGKEHSVHDLHPALTPTDPLQGIILHENEVESTVVFPPKDSASNRSAVLVGGEPQTGELRDGSIGKKDFPASTKSNSSEDLTTPIQDSRENNPYHFAEMVFSRNEMKLKEIPKRTTATGGNSN